MLAHTSWRWAFFINLPLAVVVMIISLWRIPESRSEVAEGVDWWGGFLATIGLGGLVNGFIESVNLGWRNPVVIVSLLVGFGGLVGFMWVEAVVTSPMLPLELFASRSFAGANLLTLFLYAATGIFFFLFPLDLIQVQGYSTTATGAAVLPMILLLSSLSRWSGGLVARYGARGPLVMGPLVAAVGFALFAAPSVGGTYWRAFFPAVMVLGLGMAITVAPLTTVVMNSISQDRVGTASGINNAVARVAAVLAVAVLGIVMVKAFAFRLDGRLARFSLPPAIVEQLQANEIKLAGLQVPAGLDPSTQAAIEASIGEAFVFGFRIVMLTCAGLSLGSAAVGWFMIEKDLTAPASSPERAATVAPGGSAQKARS
jgi:MFS family permease